MDWVDNPLAAHFRRSFLDVRPSTRWVMLELAMGAIVAALLIEVLMRAAISELLRIVLLYGVTGLVAGVVGTIVLPLRLTRLRRAGVIDALRVTPLLGRELAWGIITPILLGNLLFWALLLVIVTIRSLLTGGLFGDSEISFSDAPLMAIYGLVQCALASALTLRLCLRGHPPSHACALSTLWLVVIPWVIFALLILTPVFLGWIFRAPNHPVIIVLPYALALIVILPWQLYKGWAIMGLVDQAGDELARRED
jgi:hypothetical protein